MTSPISSSKRRKNILFVLVVLLVVVQIVTFISLLSIYSCADLNNPCSLEELDSRSLITRVSAVATYIVLGLFILLMIVEIKDHLKKNRK
jgi:uncharacterized BrkB/YihY/UPF0761 family membrane protein